MQDKEKDGICSSFIQNGFQTLSSNSVHTNTFYFHWTWVWYWTWVFNRWPAQ